MLKIKRNYKNCGGCVLIKLGSALRDQFFFLFLIHLGGCHIIVPAGSWPGPFFRDSGREVVGYPLHPSLFNGIRCFEDDLFDTATSESFWAFASVYCTGRLLCQESRIHTQSRDYSEFVGISGDCFRR